MEDSIDTCPKCASEDLRYLGAYNVECRDCEHEWNLRVQHGLSPTHCEACGHRLSFGCGHEPEHERAAIAERETVEHQSGACWHYDHSRCNPEHCERAGISTPGYAPFVSHREQAMKYGAADPHTGDAFTRAQRQHWIETGKIVEVADTFPVCPNSDLHCTFEEGVCVTCDAPVEFLTLD